jgi:DUF438 domain-containing protein
MRIPPERVSPHPSPLWGGGNVSVLPLPVKVSFADEVKRNTELVAIPEEWKEKFLARIETWETESVQAAHQQIERAKEQLNEVKSKIDRLNTAFTDGSLDIQEFKELKNPLVPRKVEFEQLIIALEKSRTNRLEPLRKWVLEANQAEKWASIDNGLEMKSFLKKVGSNRLLRAQTLTVSFKKPWNLLAETTVAVRSTSDISTRSSRWWRRRELNPRPWQMCQLRLHA